MITEKDDVSKIYELHRTEYETSPDVVVSAPGLIRIAGEHTIMSGGYVVSMPFNRRVSIAISGRRDASIRFYAADFNERKRTNLSNLKLKKEDRWANYIKAAIAVYADIQSSFRGFNITITGNIPQNLGLGSATALESAAIKAIDLITGKNSSPKELAKNIVNAEKNYFDRKSYSGDYLASLTQSESSFIYIDCVTNETEVIKFPFIDKKIILTDSKVPGLLFVQELHDREKDCEHGFNLMKTNNNQLFRDFTTEDLDEYMGSMPEQMRRHCMFFLEEIQRAKEIRDALINKNINLFSRAINKSQSGLRNYYEVSCPEIDWLVKRSLEINGIVASRMTGKGFGGCTVTFMNEQSIAEYSARLEEYERIFGFKTQALEIIPGSGIIAL